MIKTAAMPASISTVVPLKVGCSRAEIGMMIAGRRRTGLEVGVFRDGGDWTRKRDLHFGQAECALGEGPFAGRLSTKRRFGEFGWRTSERRGQLGGIETPDQNGMADVGVG
jgi:hypothetical protein